MVQVANEKAAFNAGISIVEGGPSELESNDGSYTLVLRGIREEEFINQRYHVDVVRRTVNPYEDFQGFIAEAHNQDLQFIISNASGRDSSFDPGDKLITSVASTFPGKLTQLLYSRFKAHIDNAILILPTGRHEHNGTLLKQEVLKYCTHWNLPSEFNIWVSMHISFCNTLVDREVAALSRKPNMKLSGIGELVLEGEWFHQWVIEGPRWIEEMLPLRKAGLNVIYTDNLEPYHLRRTRILRAAAVCLGCLGTLAETQTIRDAIEHPFIGRYIKRMIYDDIIPIMPGDIHELERYAEEVIDRLRNPAIGISLDRLAVDTFERFSSSLVMALESHALRSAMIPDRLVFALATFIAFFHPDQKDRHEEQATIDRSWVKFQSNLPLLCVEVISKAWSTGDWRKIPGLAEKTAGYLQLIRQSGVVEALKVL